MIIDDNDVTVEFSNDAATKNAVFDRLIQFFISQGVFCGESIMQIDNAQIEAPLLLADIADNILKFKITWKV